MTMLAGSASMMPVVIMWTAICTAVQRTGRMQSTKERRSRMSGVASSPARPTSASARYAPSSAARIRITDHSTAVSPAKNAEVLRLLKAEKATRNTQTVNEE